MLPTGQSEGRPTEGWQALDSASARRTAIAAADRIPVSPPARLAIRSQGRCIVYGRGQLALDVGIALLDRLDVTIVLADVGDASPLGVVARVGRGTVSAVRGSLGAFRVSCQDLAWATARSRSTFDFSSRQAAEIECDIFLDISDGASLVSGCQDRDGYLRANARDPLSLAKALLAASELVGNLEKPRYIELDAGICVHSRNRKTGCSNCLDNCPAIAIYPAGDHVLVDPALCEGCGICSAVCPTGAVSYRLPSPSDLITLTRSMLAAYAAAGGVGPVLLLHEAEHGEAIFEASFRFGNGLPQNVIPLAVHSILQIGHDLLLALLLARASQVMLLVPPRHRAHLHALEQQSVLTDVILQSLGFGPRIVLVTEDDPDALVAIIGDCTPLATMPLAHFSLNASKREIARMAFAVLHEHAPQPQDVIALPSHAPYGSVSLAEDRCSLCLACVAACPTGALRDNPESPALRFAEASCVQCGICAATCPEQAITLVPRLDVISPAAEIRVLKAEEPFCCRTCGKPFGSRASIERVKHRLAGNSHFQDEQRLKLVEMCADCRVVAMLGETREPMAADPRPRVVTSDDYLNSPGIAGSDPR